MNECAPDEGPPPRDVQLWTRVVGHVVVRRPERTFCSCRWSHTGAGGDAAATEHLRTAWPILVPHQDGETHAEWRHRVAVAHAEAMGESERLWSEHRMDESVQPGRPFPLTPADRARADDRVEVLERQLADLTAKLM